VLAVCREFDLENGIRRRGLERQVGNRGILLPERVRVRLGLTRALLRQPEILVVDRATDHLEGGAATLLKVVEDIVPRASVIASVSGDSETALFPDTLRVEQTAEPLRNAAE
jgi:putative ABC transport system ATP-binding protein